MSWKSIVDLQPRQHAASPDMILRLHDFRIIKAADSYVYDTDLLGALISELCAAVLAELPRDSRA